MKAHRLVVSFFVLFLIFFSSYAFADSFTFSTEIDGVSNYKGFGRDLFPVGTTFAYSNYFKVYKEQKQQTQFFLQANMQFNTSWVDTDYDYLTGEPRWANTNAENKSLAFLPGGQYFNPRSYIEAWVQQGFGKNPVSGGSPLVNIRFGINSYYSIALEKINSSSFIFVNADGTPKSPYGDGFTSPAFPWMEGNRRALNNYLFLRTYWYMTRYIARDFSEGIYGELSLEYGPSWFANTLFPGGVQSDFYKLYGYLEQKLSLFSIKQDNGFVWSYLYLGHSNSISYTGGDVVPLNKLPSDRLRWSANDRIWLRFMGPQFIASDCYSYFDLSLSNNLYFGKVVNEVSQESEAIELQSSIGGTFHLRLFGFIRFEYSFGYNMFRGIWSSSPGWWQNANLRFYVSV